MIRLQPHEVRTAGWSITRTATGTSLEEPSGGTRVELTIATEVVAVAPAPDGRTLAIGGAAGDVWWIPIDADNGAPVRADVTLGGAVQALVWSPDGRELAVLAAGGSAKVFDVLSRRVRATLPTDDYRAARWQGDGRLELLSRSAVVRWRLDDAESEVPSDAHGLRAWILAAQPERRTARLE